MVVKLSESSVPLRWFLFASLLLIGCQLTVPAPQEVSNPSILQEVSNPLVLSEIGIKQISDTKVSYRFVVQNNSEGVQSFNYRVVFLDGEGYKVSGVFKLNQSIDPNDTRAFTGIHHMHNRDIQLIKSVNVKLRD